MSPAKALHSAALLLACVSLMASGPALAAFWGGIGGGFTTGLGGIWGGGWGGIQNDDCFAGPRGVDSCLSQIQDSYLRSQSRNVKVFHTFKHSCCRAILRVEDESCWQRLFPSSPSFSGRIRGQCRLQDDQDED